MTELDEKMEDKKSLEDMILAASTVDERLRLLEAVALTTQEAIVDNTTGIAALLTTHIAQAEFNSVLNESLLEELSKHSIGGMSKEDFDDLRAMFREKAKQGQTKGE